MNPLKLLHKLRRGALHNIAFVDFTRLVESFGFRLKRSGGSHRIYSHPACDEDLNLQPLGRDAKPYQVRQFLNMVERYNLKQED